MSASPFYTDKHVHFRKKMREFVEAELLPNVELWDERGTIDKDVLKRAYSAGVYSPHWPEAHGGTPPEGNPKPLTVFAVFDTLAFPRWV